MCKHLSNVVDLFEYSIFLLSLRLKFHQHLS